MPLFSAGVSKPPCCCCRGSKSFTVSPRSRSPTRMVSGTAKARPSLGSLFRFLPVRLPGSGKFSHSTSVTAASPRFKSANCVWSFGRSARRRARSSASLASLGSDQTEYSSHTDETDIPPSSFPSLIHTGIHMLVYLVSFLVISLIYCTSK